MKTPRLLLLVLTFFTLGVPFAGVAEALVGKIHGVVEDICQPSAADTLVFIPGRSFVVVTGSSGDFLLDAVPVGTYTVRVESPGRAPHDIASVVVKAGKTTNLGTITVGDLQTDVNNCGACGVVCSTSHSTPACIAGNCHISSCNVGFANCDGDPANGCETNIQTSVANCGGCGFACSSTHGTPSCTAGTCQISCDGGFANCDGDPANGCETDLTSSANCGACGFACSTGQSCAGGVCQ